jgi:hypothetical protein
MEWNGAFFRLVSPWRFSGMLAPTAAIHLELNSGRTTFFAKSGRVQKRKTPPKKGPWAFTSMKLLSSVTLYHWYLYPPMIPK